MTEQKLESDNLEWLSNLLDTKFRGPFGFRFGLDGLIGLIPGVGDAVTSFLSFVIVGHAAVNGISISVILKMLWNIIVDNLISSVPLLGMILDFFWKSNQKNIKLIKEYSRSPSNVRRRTSWEIALIIIALALIFIIVIYGMYRLFALLLGLVVS